MGRLEISAPARGDLDEIWLYIAADNPEAADRHIEQIFSQCESLSRNPRMGRRRNDLLQDARSFPVGNYVIFYQARDQGAGVTILRVLEGHRDITPDMFLQQADQLRTAKTVVEEDGEDSPVALALEGIGRGCIEEGARLIIAECRRLALVRPLGGAFGGA